MTKTADDMLTKHYQAHTLNVGEVEEVLSRTRAYLGEKPELRAEFEKRLENINAIGLSDVDLSQRDYSAYVELKFLRKILGYDPQGDRA